MTKPPFQREDRYIVIKRKDLAIMSPVDCDLSQSYLHHIEAMIASWDAPSRQFLVIESDWPEYEATWQSIEARMNGVEPAIEREIHRYEVVTMLSENGSKIAYDPHGPEVVVAEAHDSAMAALRLQLAQANADAERWRFMAAVVSDEDFGDAMERLEPNFGEFEPTTPEEASANIDQCIKIARDNGLWPRPVKDGAQ